MTSRNTHGRTAAQQQPVGAARQNEYFVPRDGIDREVITSDICRYLGNDALVRPGTYENPATGAVVQGYFITAYRNLTTAMIDDLKADSARWDQERRAHQRSASGGGITSRDSNGVRARKSNSPTVQYRFSETHSNRQQAGPTGDGPAFADGYARDYDAQPRYPGSGAVGYTGATTSGYGQAAGGPAYGQPAAYAPQGGGYPGSYGGVTQPQYATQQDPRYGGAQNMMSAGYSAPEIYAQGSNRPIMSDPRYGTEYGQSTAGRDRMATTMGAPQQGGMYPVSASQAQQSFPATAAAPAPGYYQQVQVPATASSAFAAVQPADPFFGRAGSAAPQGYSAAQGQQQQYEETPSIPRTSAPATSSQMAISGSTTSQRRSDRESDRHSTERRHRQNHRS
jgi:hypothetical protein